jgi:hypothetical protein
MSSGTVSDSQLTDDLRWTPKSYFVMRNARETFRKIHSSHRFTGTPKEMASAKEIPQSRPQ